MAKGQIWETRPLEFWNKAKELRAGWQKSIESKDMVVGQGNTGMAGSDWGAAFPAIKIIEDNPVGAMMQNKNEAYARRARLASETRGWGREICGYQGNCWGGQFLGYIEDDTPWPKRKLVVPMPSQCDQHTKRGQQARDFENMPQWNGDACIYLGPHDAERNKHMLEHDTYCSLKILNDIERIFGQWFDDERFVELMNANKEIKGYSREITALMGRTIPSPLSVKDLYSVYTIGGLTRVDPGATLEFWRIVRDEVKWRAENRIAAVGNERFRYMESNPPSWHYLKYYRYLEQYGACCIGSQYSHMMSGMDFHLDPDGSIHFVEAEAYPDDTPINTREDAIRYGLGPDVRSPLAQPTQELICPEEALVSFAKAMQADGALLAVWRGGIGCTQLRKQHGMFLKKAGLSVLHYEGSQPGDRTDLDEKRLLDQLDTWMQSNGLRKFEEN